MKRLSPSFVKGEWSEIVQMLEKRLPDHQASYTMPSSTVSWETCLKKLWLAIWAYCRAELVQVISTCSAVILVGMYNNFHFELKGVHVDSWMHFYIWIKTYGLYDVFSIREYDPSKAWKHRLNSITLQAPLAMWRSVVCISASWITWCFSSYGISDDASSGVWSLSTAADGAGGKNIKIYTWHTVSEIGAWRRTQNFLSCVAW